MLRGLLFLLYKTILLFAVIIVCQEHIIAQTLSDTLKEVKIERRKKQKLSQDTRVNDFTPGQKTITIDSALLLQYKMQSAAQLLSQQVPVFIKSYGLNGLATLNFRGASAAQSQVYWNGVPLQNAALGIADISLLPVSFIDRLQILYGSASALLGSGNVGGALLLETNRPMFDSMIKINYELGLGAGSYSQYQFAGKSSISGKRWYASMNLLGQTARNDFKYTDANTAKINEHAILRGGSGMAQVGYKVNGENTLRAIAWYQQYDREIPAALFESYSTKSRKDVSLKLYADWDRRTVHSEQYLRASFISDKMHYDDSAVKLFTSSVSRQYYIEAGWKQALSNRHKILLFTPVHLSRMDLDTTIGEQSKYALAIAYNYSDTKERLHVSVNGRGEIINNNSIFLPGVNASYVLSDWMTLRANVQKTYRAPSLNELYFEPGGNKSLRPEKGWSQDAGYTISFKPVPSFAVYHDIAVFHRLIDDWIIWYGGAIWTPHNIASVRSTGIELEYLFKYSTGGNAVFHLGIKGSYTKSVTVESYMAGDGSINKQIPYTPEWLGLANAGFCYKSFYFNYNHVYTGLRYYNTDETGLLPSYNTDNIQLSKDFAFSKVVLQAGGMVNNIFNKSYTVVASRPMPGRNIALSFTLRKK